MRKKNCCGFVCMMLSLAGMCQQYDGLKNDTNFYHIYPKLVTARFYFSQKYTDFKIKSTSVIGSLHYKPNTTMNMGVGATYHNISVNIAYGFGFLNNDEQKGKTDYLDLQGHAYLQKWTVNWYGQFYNGYYLSKEEINTGGPDNYHRPDLHVNLAGVSAYRLVNDRRFSFRASMLENEWQTHSAGTLLYSGHLFYGKITADSSFIPMALQNGNQSKVLNKINFFVFAPGIGYAYTYVLQQHFFVTGALVLNVDAGAINEEGEGKKFSIEPGYDFITAIGYNSKTWNISANFVQNKLRIKGNSQNEYTVPTGNYRFIISKKLTPSPKVKKKLNLIDKLL